MMAKYIFTLNIKTLLTLLCVISITNHAMVKVAVPSKIVLQIIAYSCASQNTSQMATHIINLRRINKQANKLITQNIATLLNINEQNKDAFLVTATNSNSRYFMRVALKHKADPNPPGYPPLFYATYNRSYHTCKFLLRYGANITHAFTPGITFLDIAAEKHDYRLLKLLNKAYCKKKQDYTWKWYPDLIASALKIVTNKKVYSQIDIDNKMKCIKLLKRAKDHA